MNRNLALLFCLLPSLVPAAEMLSLDADEYTLTLRHEAKHPPVRFPRDEIAKEHYLPAKAPEVLRLRFFEDRSEVEIHPRNIYGKLASADAGTRVYQLSKGVFAGGRLMVAKAEPGLTATFTVFGSGVPVIASAYDPLEPVADEEDGARKLGT